MVEKSAYRTAQLVQSLTIDIALVSAHSILSRETETARNSASALLTPSGVSPIRSANALMVSL